MLKKIIILTVINLMNLQITTVDSEIKNILNIKESQTIAYYNDNAQQWIDTYGAETQQSYWMKEISIFKKYISVGSILEIGVGGAGEADEFIKNGYIYTGIDAAAHFIAIAQKRFPTATFLHKNIFDLNASNGTFDSFWCAAVLLHIPLDKIDTALQKIKAVMKPGAIGFISLAQGHGEYFNNEKTGRYFYLYEQDEFTNILHRNGFAIEESHIRYQDISGVWSPPWLNFFVRVHTSI